MFSRKIFPAILTAAFAALLLQPYAQARFGGGGGFGVSTGAGISTGVGVSRGFGFNPGFRRFRPIVVVPSGFGYVQGFSPGYYDVPPTASFDSTDYSLRNTTQPPRPPQPAVVPQHEVHPLIQEWNQPAKHNK